MLDVGGEAKQGLGIGEKSAARISTGKRKERKHSKKVAFHTPSNPSIAGIF